MTLTKAQIIDSISNHLDLSKTKSTELVESFLETIKSSLESGEDVLISVFGKFNVQNNNERLGRNPATGEDLMLGSRRVVTFSCSGKLRERMNGKRSSPSIKD